jgi:hypothetical protein
MPNLTDMINQYGGKWYDFGRQAGMPGWFRTPGIDMVGRPVWSPEYGWQSWNRIRNLGGDYSGLTGQFGDVSQYFQAKPVGTSDPELRARFGQNWQQYIPGAEQRIQSMPGYMANFYGLPQPQGGGGGHEGETMYYGRPRIENIAKGMEAPNRTYNNMPSPAGYYRQQRRPYRRGRHGGEYR